jgi:hypothetical protein
MCEVLTGGNQSVWSYFRVAGNMPPVLCCMGRHGSKQHVPKPPSAARNMDTHRTHASSSSACVACRSAHVHASRAYAVILVAAAVLGLVILGLAYAPLQRRVGRSLLGTRLPPGVGPATTLLVTDIQVLPTAPLSSLHCCWLVPPRVLRVTVLASLSTYPAEVIWIEFVAPCPLHVAG